MEEVSTAKSRGFDFINPGLKSGVLDGEIRTKGINWGVDDQIARDFGGYNNGF